MKKILILLVFLIPNAATWGAKIRDVTHIGGISETQLVGYGLVVGLEGTGDGPRTKFTTQSIINMLRNIGIELSDDRLRLRNVAAVTITAALPAFAKKGSRTDVLVSSIGDARSLEGGTLILSPLQAVDGEIYALAQGPLTVGGYTRRDPHIRASVQKNHALVGRIPDGALVQREILTNELPQDEVQLILEQPDFTSAVVLASAVNAAFETELASAQDASSVVVSIPQEFWGKVLEFIARLEQIEFQPSVPARIVINERTGTIIAGGNVTMGEVAVSHGNIKIEIKASQQTEIAQQTTPTRAAQAIRQTTVPEVEVEEQDNEMKVLPPTTNVSDLASALNSLGVKPRDVIAILEAIKKSGALNAELVVM